MIGKQQCLLSDLECWNQDESVVQQVQEQQRKTISSTMDAVTIDAASKPRAHAEASNRQLAAEATEL